MYIAILDSETATLFVRPIASDSAEEAERIISSLGLHDGMLQWQIIKQLDVELAAKLIN